MEEHENFRKFHVFLQKLQSKLRTEHKYNKNLFYYNYEPIKTLNKIFRDLYYKASQTKINFFEAFFLYVALRYVLIVNEID